MTEINDTEATPADPITEPAPAEVNDGTPVEPTDSYTPTSYIYAPASRSMGGEVDEAPVSVETEIN